MAKEFQLVILAVTLCLAVTMVTSYDGELDPFDMINFDPSTMKMNKKSKKVTVDTDPNNPEKPDNPPPGKNINSPVETLNKDSMSNNPPQEKMIRIPVETLNKDATPRQKMDITKCPIRVSTASLLFRQYVNTLLYHLKGKVYEGGAVEFDLRLILDNADLNKLQRYSDSQTEMDLNTAHEILTRMIQTIKEVPIGGKTSRHLWIEDRLGISIEKLLHVLLIIGLIVVIATIMVHLKFNKYQLMYYLFILVFIVSVCLTWYSLYKREVSKQHYAVSKEMPEHCKSREDKESGFLSVTWSWMVSQVTFQKDECIDYYEQLLIDPIVKVSPIEALAVTAVRFFVTPLRHIAEGLSDFTRTLLKDLPIQLWPIVLVIMTIFGFLVLFMGFGYRVGMPFGMLTIEPGRRDRNIEIQALDDRYRIKMEEQMKQVQKMLQNVLDHQSNPAIQYSGGGGDAPSSKSPQKDVRAKKHPKQDQQKEFKVKSSPVQNGVENGASEDSEGDNCEIEVEKPKSKLNKNKNKRLNESANVSEKICVECSEDVLETGAVGTNDPKRSAIPVKKSGTDTPISDIGQLEK
ncbi:chloride channel CLIC-like protein 1 [Patella vulgata]|uniref:chloride channel CLIC-like protein 1 n=1 Tax=Patella vulgata TaxID=6465 RepID=UPI0024A87BD6|nr:chloride channel CLIC-like protein 1 [Patella vulgata]XP_050400620.2 chloride channel CLIC-like protein 1 [Patella vulgata]XP_050400621.2 chloride channel CLIC-like protein 1 [Patella vulgata]